MARREAREIWDHMIYFGTTLPIKNLHIDFIEYLRLNPPKTGLQTPKTMKLG